MLFLTYALIAIFTVVFALDFAATIHICWTDATPATPATTDLTDAATPTLPCPWENPIDVISPATPSPQITTPTQLLLAPATIVSKPPQTSDDYLQVLTVAQLRKRATASGIKNAGRMRKNQLLALLA